MQTGEAMMGVVEERACVAHSVVGTLCLLWVKPSNVGHFDVAAGYLTFKVMILPSQYLINDTIMYISDI